MFSKQNPAGPEQAVQMTTMSKHQLTDKPKHHYITGGLALLALSLFVTAGALAVVKPITEASPPPVYQARQVLDLPSPLPAFGESASLDAPFMDETRIRSGDTLAAVLQRLNIQESNLQQFLVQEESARSIYKLFPGRTVQAALNAQGGLEWLRYYHTPGTRQGGEFVSKWLEIRPDGNGGFVAQEQAEATETQMRIAEGEIRHSLFGATDAANIPDAITFQMAEILGSKIDFMRDLRKGDRFRIIYETHSHQGREVGSGRVLAIEFNNGDKVHDAIWFQPEGESGGYYDFDGKSMKGAFLRSALKVSRISSTFGMRRHPIHGNWRGHKGVDYAAPTGTPIHATADGVIDFIGVQGGYGNTIVLKHGNNISTYYAHQSRFAAGLKKGDRVEQGQLIGYVGSTGWSTGPHLHYEFRVSGTPIDPLSVDLPVAKVLTPPQMATFQSKLGAFRSHLNFLAVLQDQDETGNDTEINLASAQ
ncbi:peptidoglycan DD-metalloendopeptidase family protein [Neopusillimonas aromaticivorans]|uniref:M23 family metallopeptidase n=1 Tax=Neopusillimonas aromaticivorans TaxID=2979868 RepID=UPI003D9EC508